MFNINALEISIRLREIKTHNVPGGLGPPTLRLTAGRADRLRQVVLHIFD